MRFWRASAIIFSLAASLSAHAVLGNPPDPKAKTPADIARQAMNQHCLEAVLPPLKKSGGKFTPQVRAAYMNWAEQLVLGELHHADRDISNNFLDDIRGDATLRDAIFGAVYPPDPSILQNYVHLRSKLGEPFAKKYRSLLIAIAVARRFQVVVGDPNPLDPVSPAPPQEKKPDKTSLFIDAIADFLKTKNETALAVYQDPANQQELTAFLTQNKCDVAMIERLKDSGQLAEYLKQAMVRLGQRPANREQQSGIVDWLKYQASIYETKPASTPPLGNGSPMAWPIFPLTQAPWPLLMSMEYTVPLGEAKYTWESFQGEHGPDRFHTYGPYRTPSDEIIYELQPSHWNWNALPDRIVNGGECITMSFNTVETYGSLGIPSIFAGQPGHANLMSFQYADSMWYSQIEQAFAGGPSVTFAQWDFHQDPARFRDLYNWVGAEYPLGLALGMNVGLKSYMDTRIAVNLYSLLPTAEKQTLGVNLLRHALRINPFNPDPWYRLALLSPGKSEGLALAKMAMQRDPGGPVDGEPRNVSLEEFTEARHGNGVNGALNEYWNTIQEFVTRFALLSRPMPADEPEARALFAVLEGVPGMTAEDLSPYVARFGPAKIELPVVKQDANAVPAAAAGLEQVNAAMDKARAFLLAHEIQGNWEQVATPDEDETSCNGGQYSSLTAIATYALLCANVHEDDPRIAGAIAFLEKTPPRGVYAAALRCLVWSRTKLKGDTRVAATRDFEFLRGAMHRTGTTRGTFSYTPGASMWGDEMPYDNRVSQFAVMGLWSLYCRGFDVSNEDWSMINEAWHAHQYPDGAWLYCDNPGAGWNQHTACMTAAGIATLYQTRQCLSGNGNDVPATGDGGIASGMDWLANNFDSTFDLTREFGRHQEVDALFELSRVGVACGKKYIGNVDWYQRTADYLCWNQQADGSWTAYTDAITATSMGIMSLANGSAPVVMSKLQYDNEANPTDAASRPAIVSSVWNSRPHDLFNFTTWMGSDLQQQLNFQVVNLNTSPKNDLRDAPILYISGDGDLHFSHDELNKLRDFVFSGGLILGNADGNSQAFAAAFEQLGKDLFPSYHFRELLPDHLIFANEQKQSGFDAGKVAMRGLSNGVRELMLLPGEDLSGAFEGPLGKTHPELFRLTEDIILYAVGNASLRQKGAIDDMRHENKYVINNRVNLAYLQYDGNWNPEPGGWWRLTALVYNHDHTETAAKWVKLGDNKLVAPMPVTRPSADEIRKMAVAKISLKEIQDIGGDPVKFADLVKTKIAEIQASLDTRRKLFDLARLTGTTALHLNDQQRHELKDYVDSGGILFIDAAGGSQEFADSAEAELKIIFGKEADQLADPLPVSDPLFTAGPGKLVTFQYRPFAQAKLGSLNTPRLRGIIRGGRLAVIFSREDISAGLVGTHLDGILGYAPETATDIGKSIMMYASHTEAPKVYGN